MAPEIGSLRALANGESQFVGSSSGVFFINTVRRAFSTAEGTEADDGRHAVGTHARDDPSPEDCIVGDSDRNGQQWRPDCRSAGRPNQESDAETSPLPSGVDIMTDMSSLPEYTVARDLVLTYFRIWHPLVPFLQGPECLADLENLYAPDFNKRSSRSLCQFVIFKCILNVAKLDTDGPLDLGQSLGHPNGIQDSDIDVCPPGQRDLHEPVLKSDLHGQAENTILHLPANHPERLASSPPGRNQSTETSPEGEEEQGRHEEAGTGPPTSSMSPKAAAIMRHRRETQAVLDHHVRHSQLVGRVLEVFHKSIHARDMDNRTILFLKADVTAYGNDLTEPRFSPALQDIPQLTPDPTVFPFVSYYYTILLLNRPSLSLDSRHAEEVLSVLLRGIEEGPRSHKRARKDTAEDSDHEDGSRSTNHGHDIIQKRTKRSKGRETGADDSRRQDQPANPGSRSPRRQLPMPHANHGAQSLFPAQRLKDGSGVSRLHESQRQNLSNFVTPDFNPNSPRPNQNQLHKAEDSQLFSTPDLNFQNNISSMGSYFAPIPTTFPDRNRNPSNQIMDGQFGVADNFFDIFDGATWGSLLDIVNDAGAETQYQY
ncbi:Zn(II)2Cys6 transcription factor [Colletotrichum salicis]|uniref:Zn(II)2Cys6 transcription factor n=1 Tax=Colletotrichum salicis TaxID=1209931 RepID=A0A135RV62_9PEZI|nr:Zn(II)2Cys6 transcription factor [Colletotrichum salicis]